MQGPLNQEKVNDAAKLIMDRLIARALARDASLVDKAKVSLTKMAVRFTDRSFIGEWELILSLPLDRLRALLTSRSAQARRLRLSSPFVTAEGVDFTDIALRRRITQAAKRLVARDSQVGQVTTRGSVT